MSAGRGMLGLIWAAVRKLPDGEACLRAAVARINDRDRTNQDVINDQAYTSTKLLDERQLRELADEFRRRARLPRKRPQPRGPRGGRARRPMSLAPEAVTFIASQGERDYLEHLFDLLGWSEEGRLKFAQRQTKGAGLSTHAAVTACVAPLERMLRARGYTVVEHGRSKKWTAPEVSHDQGEPRQPDSPPSRPGRT